MCVDIARLNATVPRIANSNIGQLTDIIVAIGPTNLKKATMDDFELESCYRKYNQYLPVFALSAVTFPGCELSLNEKEEKKANHRVLLDCLAPFDA